MTADYTDVSQSPGELARILTGLGLASPGERPRVTPLAGGVSSGISRIDLASGSYCLKQALPRLKVAKDWRVPVERVFAEIRWLQLAGNIVPGHVPRVLGEDASTRCFVMEFLGDEYRVWKAELLAGRIDGAAAATVGEMLGRIHAATAHSPEIASQFANDEHFHALRLEPYLLEAARVHPMLASRLTSLVSRTASTRQVLVHGDVSPKNILLGPKGPVLLDAECAWYGDPAFDLAFCLNHLLLKAAWMPRHLESLMQAFNALQAAYFRQARFETRDALESRTASLLPALSLARIDGKSPVEYLDEPTRERVRDTAISLLSTPPSELAALARAWSLAFEP